VTAAHDYEDLHRLVDRLTPGQARELRNHALRLVDEEQQVEPAAEPRSVPRDLSFVGIIDGEPDLSARVDEILALRFARFR
jgi:hypothetical protein